MQHPDWGKDWPACSTQWGASEIQGPRQGWFTDGRSATRRAVIANWTGNGYEIRDDRGLLVAFWRHEDLEPGQRLPNGEWRLACRADPLARLYLGYAPESVPLHPATRRRARITLAVSAASILAGLALTAGLFVFLPKAGRSLTLHIPPAMEADLGDRITSDAMRNWPECHTPAGDAALALLKDRLGESLPPDKRPRHVLVVRSPIVNALSFPGGNVVLFQGLIAQAASADEVAGILGHEMTHVAERHPLNGFIRGFGINALWSLVTANNIRLLGEAVLANHYTKEDEAAADAGAVKILAAVGIGSDGLENFFRRTSASGNHLPAWLSNHPDTLARAVAVHAQRVASQHPALSPEQWDALKNICGYWKKGDEHSRPSL